MKLWQKCPICDGVGQVSGGYFQRAGDYPYWTSAHTLDLCQRCNGTGTIETPEQAESAQQEGLDG